MIFFDAPVLAEARRFNRLLAWAPRFGFRRWPGPRLFQAMLRLSQVGGDHRLARRGLRVKTLRASASGPPVDVRILRPAGPVYGLVLDFHGGGWFIGNARMDDGLNAALATAANVAVASVEYPLAPRASLSGMIDSCLAAAVWLLDGGLPEEHHLPVVIAGESAGAHLAAATLLRLKERPALLARVCGALLFYGLYDLAGSASVRQAGPGTLVLDGPGIVGALRRLTPGLDDTARRMPPLSPLYGDLGGLPPAFLIVGELDPLRDDTTEMARRWQEVASVECHLVPEAPHGFLRFPTRLADHMLAHIHQWVRERLASAKLASCGGRRSP